MATPREGYRTKDGVKVPSVTTIIGRFKDSTFLTKWAYNQGREHENLSMRHLPAPSSLYDVVGKAAQSGTIAHDMIENHILGRSEVFPESALGADTQVLTRATNSFNQYLKWQEQTRIKVVLTEKGMVSERYRFGGTLDGVATDADGKIVLIDWKTSNAVYGDYLFQLAAYALLLEECMPEYTPTGFHLLRVAKESADFAHHHYGELEEAKRGFILMRELYDIAKVVEKRA